jgi:hypothetical protein
LALRRSLAAFAVGLAALTAAPAPAHAQQGDGLTQPILETMTPTVPGIKVEVAFSANYQFLVENSTDQTVAFLADSGEPFLRVGPSGVEGNFASPTFYNSNVPDGRDTYPPQAKPGADVAPIWRKLASKPNWGWYDHRLHPTEQYLPPDVLKATQPVELGRWKVPLRVGEQAGEIQGRFEYRPPTGQFTMVQKSSSTPAKGLTIQLAPGRVVPAFFVENTSADPVVILGKEDEPFARIGPAGSEVNVRSPTWAELEQAQGKDPSDEVDARAEPKWQKVADSPRWTWLEFRAAAPKNDPPAAVIAEGKPVTVKNWSVPYLVGGKRQTIEGIVEFLPTKALAARAAGKPTGSGGGDTGDSDLPLFIGAGLTAAVLGAAIWLVTSKVRNRRTV